jgi:hypothetical protein
MLEMSFACSAAWLALTLFYFIKSCPLIDRDTKGNHSPTVEYWAVSRDAFDVVIGRMLTTCGADAL